MSELTLKLNGVEYYIDSEDVEVEGAEDDVGIGVHEYVFFISNIFISKACAATEDEPTTDPEILKQLEAAAMNAEGDEWAKLAPSYKY